LDSLKTLAPQPILDTIIADGTQINSFVGLARHPRLRSVSFKDTPLSRRPNFRISLAIVVGQHLATITGVAVTAKERSAANRFPLIARTLVQLGWDATTPVPSTDEFKKLAGEFKV
jgi:hypothetical protein